jgi:Carboxypeptidase regulatory-like domain/Neocarzinostatin family
MKMALRSTILLFVACSLAAVATPSAAQATRSLIVTPDSDLVGGDIVTLQGSGFTPLDTVYFCQGVVDGTPDPGDCGGPIDSTPTDESGDFSATYEVLRFITPPSLGMAIDCAAPSANCFMGAADFFAPGGAAAVASITFAPATPVTLAITGSVTGPDTQPLPGADVWAYTTSDSWVASLQAVTDANGTFDLPGVQAGVAYRIRFGRPIGSSLASEWFNDVPNRRSAEVVTVSFNDPTTQLDAQLDEGSSISGSATNAAGAPVPGVAVAAYGPWDTFVGSYLASTAADGSFLIDGVLSSPEFRVRFLPPAGSGLAVEWFDDAATKATADPFTVPDGQDVTGIDATLESP